MDDPLYSVANGTKIATKLDSSEYLFNEQVKLCTL